MAEARGLAASVGEPGTTIASVPAVPAPALNVANPVAQIGAHAETDDSEAEPEGKAPAAPSCGPRIE